MDLDIAVDLPEEIADQVTGILRRVCEEVARREALVPSYVSVSLVDDDAIQDLNRAYRGIDAPTDVLSFALQEEGEFEPHFIGTDAETVQCLGDIVINWPRTVWQAEEYGHSVEREVAFLTAHGMLHLIGYDHADPDAEKAMFALQEQVLDSLGFHR
ncbi:MAG: rRNA maturation RNase YbeY [Firmicutes bacterium]|nr:rRNA maturation RNase YbeY [Bacillota bacterium]